MNTYIPVETALAILQMAYFVSAMVLLVVAGGRILLCRRYEILLQRRYANAVIETIQEIDA